MDPGPIKMQRLFAPVSSPTTTKATTMMQRLFARTVRHSMSCRRTTHCRHLFAAVNHGAVYERSLQGAHGRQLELAAVEGLGKDDEDYDPFIQEELEEDDREGRRHQNDEDEDDVPIEDLGDGPGEDGDEWDTVKYNNDGSLRRSKAQLATLAAGAPAGGMLAVLELAGSQHKVTTDDILVVNRLKPVKKFAVGTVHTMDSVLLIGTSHYTLVGLPYVNGATVTVMVEEITRDAKVVVFKKRRRKNSQRRNGFRRDVTMLRILDIQPPAEYQSVPYEMRPDPELPPDHAAIESGVVQKPQKEVEDPEEQEQKSA